MIITNERHATPRDLIARYARRMTSEQRLGEIIRALCADALFPPSTLNVNLNVDLNTMLTVLAQTPARRAARPTARLRHRHPRDHPRRFLETPRNDQSPPATAPSPCAWNAASTLSSYALPTCPPRPPYPGSGTEPSATNSPETPLRRTSGVEIRANLARCLPCLVAAARRIVPPRGLAAGGHRFAGWHRPAASRMPGPRPVRGWVSATAARVGVRSAPLWMRSGASPSFCRAGRG